MTEEDYYLESYTDVSNDENALFYSPKIVQQIDDAALNEEILRKFPRLKEAIESKIEKEERKAVLEFLQEKLLINDLLNKYNMTIIDMVKFLYRKFSYVFNASTYSNKIKEIVEKNGYRVELEQ